MDIAPSKELNTKVLAFLKSEALEGSPAYASKQEQLLKESGLFDESIDTLIELRTTLAEYKQEKQKQASIKNSARSLKHVK